MKRTLTVIALILLATAARAQDRPAFTATVNQDRLMTGQSLMLTLEISGPGVSIDQPLPRPNLLPWLDFVQARQTGNYSNFSIVNGKVSRSRSVTYVYAYAARKPGEVTIPALEYTVDGQVLRTEPITVNIMKEPEMLSGGTEWVPPHDPYLQLRLDRTEVYVGQQINAAWYLYFNQAAEGWGIQKAPEVGNFLYYELGNVTSLTAMTRVFDNQRWSVAFIKSAAIFPIQEGELEIGPLIMQYQPIITRQDFFGSRRVLAGPKNLASNEGKLLVKPLPAVGKPADFAGAVGTYTLTLDRNYDTIKADTPFECTVTLEGTGHPDFITEPKISLPPGFDFYSKPPDKQMRSSHDQALCTATFKMFIVPHGPGEFILPPFTFAYFDPADGRYHTAKTEPIRLNVLPNQNAQAVAPAPDEPRLLTPAGLDLRYIKTGDRLENQAGWLLRSPAWAAGQAAPLIALIVAVGIRKRQDRLIQDHGYARKLRAGKESKKALGLAARAVAKGDAPEAYAQAQRALTRFIADTFTLPDKGMTTADAVLALEGANLSAELTAAVRDVLDECDRARFAPGSLTGQDAKALLDRVNRAMAGLAREVKS